MGDCLEWRNALTPDGDALTNHSTRNASSHFTITIMTPRTRSTNKEADFKIYYSKKVPQQVQFPHRKKVVRRRDSPEQNGTNKRQMKFLPEMMKSTMFVADSDDESDLESGGGLGENQEEEDTTLGVDDSGASVRNGAATDRLESRDGASGRKNKKRTSGFMQQDVEGDDEEFARPTFKRIRKSETSRERRRSKQPDSGTLNEEATKIEPSRTLRRQSTMTQLVDGRRPLPGAEEPEFKPVKHSLRRSSSGKGKKMGSDKKQRTLTQMIPGPTLLGDGSDSGLEEELAEIEAQDSDSQAYDDAIAKRLAQQDFSQELPGDEAVSLQDVATPGTQPSADVVSKDVEVPGVPRNVPSVVIQSAEDQMNSTSEDDYEPTQYIDAPVTRIRRTPRRSMQRQAALPQSTGEEASLPPKTGRPRFSLLSTPEKRRVREIPSSQSPPDSPLSTQVSPQKSFPSPLKGRSSNLEKVPETPSKRKQVSFQVPSTKKVQPPSLRRFESTIQDSEDEGDDLIDEDISIDVESTNVHVRARAQSAGSPQHDQAIGSHTQAILDQIDQACAIAEEDTDWFHRDSSEELGESMPLRTFHAVSPDLGEQRLATLKTVEDDDTPRRTSNTKVKREPSHDVDTEDLPVVGPCLSPGNVKTENIEVEPSLLPDHIPSSPPLIELQNESIIPSTPMAIHDESSNEEENSDEAPPHVDQYDPSQPPSAFDHQSADLDGKPVQVLRSPSVRHETQESHSSKAEQQLQNEWLSYSQYVHARPPQPSSMKVAGDMFSYDATPLPPRNNAASLPQFSSYQLSQATTVDEMTPKKNRTQVVASANTTPHKIASSQPVVWEDMPPPLFIPSSFPSPTKVRTEGWSSPVLGRTQDFRSSQFLGSLEDFSIPPPPPVDDD